MERSLVAFDEVTVATEVEFDAAIKLLQNMVAFRESRPKLHFALPDKRPEEQLIYWLVE